MVKPARWLVVVLFTVALSEAVFFIWFLVPDHPDAQRRAELVADPGLWQEPITPIPMTSNLDARKVILGRRLFSDTLFSRDNKIACDRCHNLAAGGVDGLQHEAGDGKKGKINTLTVFNSSFNFRLFWDGRAATLEDQIEFPLPHASGMNATWPEVIAKLEKDVAYSRDFLAI